LQKVAQTRRAVPPNRLSLSSVIESFESFTFPDDQKLAKKAEKISKVWKL
jgi:hypothetical protein